MPFLVVYSKNPVETIIITKKGETAYKFALKFIGSQKHNEWCQESYMQNDFFNVTESIVVYRHRKSVLDNQIYAPMVLMEDGALEAGEALGTPEYTAKFLHDLAINNTPEMATKLLTEVKGFKTSLVGKDHVGRIQICQEFIARRVRRKEHQKHVVEGTSCLSGCHICV
jgi:hypothetical protein